MSQFFPDHIEQDDPAARLRRLAEGKRLRVYLNAPHPDARSYDHHVLSAELREVTDDGLVATWNREAEEVTDLLPWASIARVETRLRASHRATSWGIGLTLFLGTCGSILDGIPGEPGRHSGPVGAAIGIVIGLLVWITTSEWTVVYGSRPKTKSFRLS